MRRLERKMVKRMKRVHDKEDRRKNTKRKQTGANKLQKSGAKVDAVEAAKRQRENDNLKRRKLEEVDRQIKELEAQKLKLSRVHAVQGAAGAESSPRESYKGVGSSKHKVDEMNQGKLKQVSGLSLKKVKNAPLRPTVSSDALGSTCCADPLFLGVWGVPKDIPPLELNARLRPSGRYWEHLSHFAFSRAAMTFPNWDIPWPRQNPVTKTLFMERLKEIYSGGWDPVWVLSKIGANIRQRRIRMRNNFKKYTKKESAPIPPGLAVESWNSIYDSLSNPQYQEVSDKCKVAADERSTKKPFSHKLGPKGVAGLIQRYVSESFDWVSVYLSLLANVYP
jgi:hypothetical protein